ncbi:MAG: ABC transporter permease [Candidatus Colwellbacteria bacterium]
MGAENFEQITIIPTFLLMPLSFLGGVFYSIKMLPPFFQGLSHFNPLLYMISGMRYGFYGVSDVDPWLALGLLTLATVILTIFTVYLFRIGYKIRT